MYKAGRKKSAKAYTTNYFSLSLCGSYRLCESEEREMSRVDSLFRVAHLTHIFQDQPEAGSILAFYFINQQKLLSKKRNMES